MGSNVTCTWVCVCVYVICLHFLNIWHDGKSIQYISKQTSSKALSYTRQRHVGILTSSVVFNPIQSHYDNMTTKNTSGQSARAHASYYKLEPLLQSVSIYIYTYALNIIIKPNILYNYYLLIHDMWHTWRWWFQYTQVHFAQQQNHLKDFLNYIEKILHNFTS